LVLVAVAELQALVEIQVLVLALEDQEVQELRLVFQEVL